MFAGHRAVSVSLTFRGNLHRFLSPMFRSTLKPTRKSSLTLTSVYATNIILPDLNCNLKKTEQFFINMQSMCFNKTLDLLYVMILLGDI